MKFKNILESSENFDRVLGKNLEVYPFDIGYMRRVLKANVRTFCGTGKNKDTLFQFSGYKDGMEITVFDRNWDKHYQAFTHSDCEIENIYSYSYDESGAPAVKSYLKRNGVSDKQLRQIYKEIVLTRKYFI